MQLMYFSKCGNALLPFLRYNHTNTEDQHSRSQNCTCGYVYLKVSANVIVETS